MSITRWQDAVIAGCQIMFCLALLPTVLGDRKPAQATATITAASMFTMMVALYSLELDFSAVAAAIGFLLWTVIVWQTRGQ